MTTIKVKILEAGDGGLLNRVVPDVLDGPVDAKWAKEFLRDSRHHLAVAIDGEKIVGAASAVHYVHPDKAPELWVNEVGVAPAYRGQRIARQMLEVLFKLAVSLGCSEAWVLTERQNEVAHRLYSSVGGRRSEDPVMYTFSLDGAPWR